MSKMQRAVHVVAARDVHDRVDVREVDDLGYVGEGEPGRLRVPVHRDDAEAPLARLRDRAALVASRADEEDARHGAIVDAGSWDPRRPRVERSARRRHEVVSHR